MNRENSHIEIRTVTKIEELARCVELQQAVFKLPDLEISPLRHLIVSINAGGFVLAAFAGAEIVGFVLHLVALRGDDEIIGYSHMTAISPDFQNAGVGAKLKWAQRERVLQRGQKFIKWTFDPMQSRNAHFNLNRLGAVIRSYAANYYGTDYDLRLVETERVGLDSDRLFAEWELDSERVKIIERGETLPDLGEVVRTIEIPANWKAILETSFQTARQEQARVRREFQNAFDANLICAGFERGAQTSKYLFYQS